MIKADKETTLSCPADFVMMNEYKARLIAFQVLLVAVLIAIFSYWPLILLLTADFSLRAFNFGKYSPLGKISDGLIRLLAIGNKPVDQAPKRFAATIGLSFSGAMLLSFAFSYPLVTSALAGALIIFSFLESVFAFCAGCHVYTLLQRIHRKRIL